MSDEPALSLPNLCLKILREDGGSWSVAEITDHLETKYDDVCDDHYVTKSSVAKAVNSLCRRADRPVLREPAGDSDGAPGSSIIPTKWRYRASKVVAAAPDPAVNGQPAKTAPRTALGAPSAAPPAVAAPFAALSVSFSSAAAHRLEHVLARGLHGRTPAEVVERIVCNYLATAFG